VLSEIGSERVQTTFEPGHFLPDFFGQVRGPFWASFGVGSAISLMLNQGERVPNQRTGCFHHSTRSGKLSPGFPIMAKFPTFRQSV
jgi:hypothetical protein